MERSLIVAGPPNKYIKIERSELPSPKHAAADRSKSSWRVEVGRGTRGAMGRQRAHRGSRRGTRLQLLRLTFRRLDGELVGQFVS